MGKTTLKPGEFYEKMTETDSLLFRTYENPGPPVPTFGLVKPLFREQLTGFDPDFPFFGPSQVGF